MILAYLFKLNVIDDITFKMTGMHLYNSLNCVVAKLLTSSEILNVEFVLHA